MVSRMNSKFSKGQKVKFIFNGVEKIGIVEIVDTFGAFAEVSYDIYIVSEPCLYKHVVESSVLCRLDKDGGV